MVINCRVCGSICYKNNLLSYSNMPSSAQGFLTAEGLKSDAGSDLFIIQCMSCGLIQLDNDPVPYYKEVIRASAFSEEMRKFRSKQFKSWVKEFNLTNSQICLWASCIVQNQHFQGNLPKTYFLTSWLRQQSEMIQEGVEAGLCRDLLKNLRECSEWDF